MTQSDISMSAEDYFEIINRATYAEQRAESAEARADTYAETIETLVNEKAQAEQERDGYKEAAHDWHMNYLDAIAKRDELRAAYLGSLKTIEELRLELIYFHSTDLAADAAMAHYYDDETPLGQALDGQGDEVEP